MLVSKYLTRERPLISLIMYINLRHGLPHDINNKKCQKKYDDNNNHVFSKSKFNGLSAPLIVSKSNFHEKIQSKSFLNYTNIILVTCLFILKIHPSKQDQKPHNHCIMNSTVGLMERDVDWCFPTMCNMQVAGVGR